MTFVRGEEEDEAEGEWAARSAASAFEQLIEAVDGPEPHGTGVGGAGGRLGPDGGSGPGDPSLDEIRAAVMRSVDLYSDLLQRVLALYADAVQGWLDRSGTGVHRADTTVELSGR